MRADRPPRRLGPGRRIEDQHGVRAPEAHVNATLFLVDDAGVGKGRDTGRGGRDTRLVVHHGAATLGRGELLRPERATIGRGNFFNALTPGLRDVERLAVGGGRKARRHAALLGVTQAQFAMLGEVTLLEGKSMNHLRRRAANVELPSIRRPGEPVKRLLQRDLRNERAGLGVEDPDLVLTPTAVQDGGKRTGRVQRDVHRKIPDHSVFPHGTQRPLVGQQHRAVALEAGQRHGRLRRSVSRRKKQRRDRERTCQRNSHTCHRGRNFSGRRARVRQNLRRRVTRRLNRQSRLISINSISNTRAALRPIFGGCPRVP